MKLLDSETKNLLQTCWMKLLLKQNCKEALAALDGLDGTVKSSLDPAAGALLRSLQVMQDLYALDSIYANIKMPSKAGVKELMARLMQVLYIDPADAETAGFSDFPAKKTQLMKFFADSIQEMLKDFHFQRSKVDESYSKFNGIVAAVNKWDEERL